jgi:hypothetical protein
VRKLSGVVVVLVIAAIGPTAWLLWRQSTGAAPVHSRYTMADLRSVPQECRPSYDTLIRLAGLQVPDAMSLVDELTDGGYPSDAKVLEKASQIEEAWEGGHTGRQFMVGLNKFDEIADMTDPASTQYSVSESILTIMKLRWLYHAHVMLNLARGNERAAVEEVIEFDSVLRKLDANLRGMLAKSVCNELLQADMSLAASMADRQNVSRETVELLARHFVPLSEEQTTWQNCIVFASLIGAPLTDKEVEQRKADQIRVMIRDDMLQIVLSRSLGRSYSLKARTYGDEYVIDANAGKIVSPGPDGKMGTADDIWLPISK